MEDARRRHPRFDLYIADREKGMTYKEIAEKHGVSHQAVSQLCRQRSVGHFKPYTEEEVVYPHLRKWLNENKVARNEFARRLGIGPSPGNSNRISAWFRGTCYPNKSSIDKILAATGLTYEKLFEREGA